jgi:hypothetical protein
MEGGFFRLNPMRQINLWLPLAIIFALTLAALACVL